MATHSKIQLEGGWVFKQEDDASSDPWLPVSRVPTQIHMDLLNNKKCVSSCFLRLLSR